MATVSNEVRKESAISKTLRTTPVVPETTSIIQFKGRSAKSKKVKQTVIRLDMETGVASSFYVFEGSKKEVPFADVAFNEEEAKEMAFERAKESRSWNPFKVIKNFFGGYKIIRK